MSRFFLRRLSIEGFRGINNEGAPLVLDFSTDGVNSIYAINAFGKSSIFQALQYAITGSVSKLEAMMAAEHPERYYNNLFHTGSAKIEMTFAADDGAADIAILVQRTKAGVRTISSPSGHVDPQGFLASLASDLALLDCATFETFIGDSPLERGRSFASLVGLSQLSELRQALEVLSNSGTMRRDFEMDALDAEVAGIREGGTRASSRLRVSYEALLGRLPTEPLVDAAIGTDALAALRAIPLLASLITVTKLEETDFSTIEAEIARAEGSTLRAELAGIVSKLTHLATLGPATASAEATEQANMRASINKRDAALTHTRGPEFLKLAEAASRLLSVGKWTEPRKCPLCGSDVKNLIQHVVEAHLAQYKVVTDEQTQIAKLWDESTWGARLTSCEASQPLGIAPASRVVARIERKMASGTVTLAEFEQLVVALTSAEQLRQTAVTQATTRKAQIEAALPPSLVALTKQVQHAKDIRQALIDRGASKTQWLAAKAKQMRRLQWQLFIVEAAARAATLESAVSGARIQRIEAQTLALFADVMNRPSITPSLARGNGEALHLQLERFYDLNDLSATALLSESFRNALAISIFLSAILESRPTARFVVLDDITSSFDGGFQYRLMEMLRTRVAAPANSAGPQIIVLSHDSMLEKYFDRMGNEVDWHHQKLQGSPPQGMLVGQAIAADRIKVLAQNLLQAGQVDQGQGLVRQYMEYVLMQVIRKVMIRVPVDFAMHDTNRMVGACLTAIAKDVGLHRAAGTLILTPQQEADLSGAIAPAILANWVSHYETGGGGTVAPAVLLGVIDSIDAYADCFKYACRCGGGVVQRRWYKSLTSRACPCV
jgi:hypothetical protein